MSVCVLVLERVGRVCLYECDSVLVCVHACWRTCVGVCVLVCVWCGRVWVLILECVSVYVGVCMRIVVGDACGFLSA